MRILHTVEFYSPSVGGAQEVIKQISERLVRRGHAVTVATTSLAARTDTIINGVRVQPFSISGNSVRGFEGRPNDYSEFLLQGDFDIMMNYAAQQWATDLVFPLLGCLPYPTVLAPCGFSGLRNPDYATYFERLPDVLRQYDGLLFHSDTYQDIAFARQHGIDRCTVIPNGASEDEFGHVTPDFRQRYGIPDDIPLLLTVGSHTGLKGHRLVMEAFRRARIGRAALVVIGNTRGQCYRECRFHSRAVTALSGGHKRVFVLDPPRPDVVAAYHAADLFVFGSNVECSPLVLFEAMASGTPFATTACGNAEEIAQWGHGGIVVPTRQLSDGRVTSDPSIMARAIEEIIRDPETRHGLAQDGHRAWLQRFTWEGIVAQYEQLYSQISKGQSTTLGVQALS